MSIHCSFYGDHILTKRKWFILKFSYSSILFNFTNKSLGIMNKFIINASFKAGFS